MKSKTPIPVRSCELCKRDFRTKSSDRYCDVCRKVIKAELYRAGYLKPVPSPTSCRPESRHEREGEPSPWGENAVRALEGD